MPRNETPDALQDLLQAYEINDGGYIVTRRQPGVLIQRAGAHATLRNRGDGTFSLILADGTDHVHARVVFALTHSRWPVGSLLARDGDDTNVDPANLVEEDTLDRDDLAAIHASYEARWAAITAAEEAAQRSRQQAVAQREANLQAVAARKAEGTAKNDAVAALWMADAEDLAEMEERDREKLAAREARAAAREAAALADEPEADPVFAHKGAAEHATNEALPERRRRAIA